MIEVARDAGWELEKPHLIDFELVFDTYEAASEACESLGNIGFASEVIVDQTSGAYDCHARKRFVLSVEELNAESALVEETAEVHGGVLVLWSPVSEP